MRKYVSLLLVSILAMSLVLSACSVESFDDETPMKLKVLFWDESSFYSAYGNYFSMEHPNVEFEVLSLSEIRNYDYSQEEYMQVLSQYIDEKQPDLLMLQPDEFERFAQDGKLYELDSMIKKDKFDIENILPSVMEKIRDKGNGKIYGLTPAFYSNALYYNIDLFEEYGVEQPTNQMSWEEVINLAKRFPTTGSDIDRVYGLSSAQRSWNAAELLLNIGDTENLRMLDPAGEKVLFNSDNWRQSFALALDGLKSGAIFMQSQDDMENAKTIDSFYTSQPFLMGKVAMQLGESGFMNDLRQVKSRVKDYKPFNWGVVTVPVSHSDPNTSTQMSLSSIWSVNAKSTNQSAAWEFVKFLNGARFAKMSSRELSWDLPTRKEYIKDKENHNLEAFYLLNFRPDADSMYDDEVLGEFYSSQDQIIEEQMELLIDDEQTEDQTVDNIQMKLEGLLLQAKIKAKADKE